MSFRVFSFIPLVYIVALSYYHADYVDNLFPDIHMQHCHFRRDQYHYSMQLFSQLYELYKYPNYKELLKWKGMLGSIPQFVLLNKTIENEKMPCSVSSIGFLSNSSSRIIESSDIVSSSPNRTLLSVVVSDEKTSVPDYLVNALSLLSLYQNLYPFKTLVVSSSPSIILLCKKLSIKTISKVESNPYGLPYVRSLLEELKRQFDSDFYGYINSDILISPNVLLILSGLQKMKPSFSANGYLVAGRVYDRSGIQLSLSMRNNMKIFQSTSKTTMRQPNSADIFFFSHEYPLEIIPNIVIGRWLVDNILLQNAFMTQHTVIDISHAAVSIHQGFSKQTTIKRKTKKKDFWFNGAYLDKSNHQRSLMKTTVRVCPL